MFGVVPTQDYYGQLVTGAGSTSDPTFVRIVSSNVRIGMKVAEHSDCMHLNVNVFVSVLCYSNPYRALCNLSPLFAQHQILEQGIDLVQHVALIIERVLIHSISAQHYITLCGFWPSSGIVAVHNHFIYCFIRWHFTNKMMLASVLRLCVIHYMILNKELQNKRAVHVSDTDFGPRLFSDVCLNAHDQGNKALFSALATRDCDHFTCHVWLGHGHVCHQVGVVFLV